MTIPAGLVATLFTSTTTNPVTETLPTPTLTTPDGFFYDGSTITVSSTPSALYEISSYQWYYGWGDNNFDLITDPLTNDPITSNQYTVDIGQYDFPIKCEVTYTEIATGLQTVIATQPVLINSQFILTSASSRNGDAVYDEPVTITLTALGIPDGTLVPYTIDGITSEELSGASLTGNFTVSNNSGTVVLTVSSSAYQAGSGINFNLDNGRYGIYINVVDPAALAFLSNPVIATTDLSTQVYTGKELSVTFSAVNAVTTEYSWYKAAEGFIPILNANTSTLTITDEISGGVRCQVTIYDSAGNYLSAWSNVLAVTDRFISLNASTSNTPEGNIVTFTLETVGIPNGTVVPYTISGDQVTGQDFSNGTLTGSFIIENNSGVVSITIAEDNKFEADETFTLSLNNGKKSVTVVVQGSTITGLPAFLTTPVMVSSSGVFNDTSVISIADLNAENFSSISYEWKSNIWGGITLSTGSTLNTNYEGYWGDGADLYCTVTISDNAGNQVSVDTVPEIIETTFILTNSTDGTILPGQSITFTLTVNDPTVTTVPYTIYGVEATDISGSGLSGNFAVTNGIGSVTVEILLNGAFVDGSTIYMSAGNEYRQVNTQVGILSISAGAPVANFSSQTQNGITTVFTDTSVNNPTSWLWDFGDGSTSTQQNPSHSYAQTGSYTVTLTASNQYGSSSKTNTVTVSVSVVSLLLHGNGANGGNVFIDNSIYNRTPIVTGNITTSTAQSKFGSASIFPNGGSLRYSNDSSLQLGGENWTIEFWLYRTADATSNQTIISKGFDLNIVNNQLTIPGNGGTVFTGSQGIIPINTWTHIALEQNSAGIQLYINGLNLALGIYSPSASFSSTNDLIIGNTVNGSSPFTAGYLDEIIITKGLSRYNGNSVAVPTTEFTGTTPQLGPQPHPLAPVANFTLSGEYQFKPAPFTASVTDTSTNNPTSRFWYVWNGSTGTFQSTNQTETFTFTQPGYYPVFLVVTNSYGSSTATKYLTITAPAPTP